MNYMWNEKYFFFIQRLYRDFPSQKDFLTVKCSVRILMTGQVGLQMDLKMNNGTKEIKTWQRKTENSLVTLMNVVQTRLTVTSELATQQTIMPQLPN